MSATPSRYVGDFAAWNGGGLFIGSGGGSVAPHAHYALQVVVGAPDGLKVQSGRRGPWVPCAGAVIPSRMVHSIDVDACDWSVVVFVEPETLQGRALSARLKGEMTLLDAASLSEWAPELERAWKVEKSRDAVQAAAQKLIGTLSQTAERAPSDPRVLQAIEFVRSRPDETPSLEEIASAVHLSPSRFRHLFVEQTGMPLRTYLLWRRLLSVWEFLMAGESLAGAAHAAGFADSAHLSRTSRTMFGVAPSAMQMQGPLSERLRVPATWVEAPALSASSGMRRGP